MKILRMIPGVALLGRFRLQMANFTAFTAVQAASYLIPIVTIPYFARTLTIAGLGQIAIAGAAALAGGVLMDYAIILSGTRFAAKNASDADALNDHLIATSALKSLLFLPVAVAFVAAALTIPAVSEHFWVFFWSLISAAAMCLFPQWLFQGLLIIPIAARILVVTRIGAAASALALVRTPADAFVVPMCQALGGLVALAAAGLFLRRRFGMRLRRVSRQSIARMFRDNWKLFSATAWGVTNAHGAILIMGVMLPTTSVGFYSIAERISQAFVSLFNIAGQTVFPSFVRGFARNDTQFGRRVFSYVAFVAACSAVCLVILFFVREPIYHFFAGQDSDIGVIILSIWLVTSFFTVVCVSLNPIMVAMHLDSQLFSVYRFTGIAFLILAPLATYHLDAIGMALAALSAQSVVAVYCIVAVHRALTGRVTPDENFAG